MNDLEICKRIAEIEGKESIEMIQCCVGVWSDADDEFIEFDPLTDDALCFHLMKKHEVDLTSPYTPNGEVLWCADIFTKDYADALSTYDENPNKAVCLAIIEAHNE